MSHELDIILKSIVAGLVGAVGWLVSYVLKTNDRVAKLETKSAETYATNAYVREVEERLGDSLKSINDKLDRLIERSK
jgi:hypothetical protein